jgi:hypothetical protein
MYLRMLPCGNTDSQKSEFWTWQNLLLLTPLLLLGLHKFYFPKDSLKIYSLHTLAMLSSKKNNHVVMRELIKKTLQLLMHDIPLIVNLSFAGVCIFTTISYHRLLCTYFILSSDSDFTMGLGWKQILFDTDYSYLQIIVIFESIHRVSLWLRSILLGSSVLCHCRLRCQVAGFSLTDNMIPLRTKTSVPSTQF